MAVTRFRLISMLRPAHLNVKRRVPVGEVRRPLAAAAGATAIRYWSPDYLVFIPTSEPSLDAVAHTMSPTRNALPPLGRSGAVTI